MIASPAEAIQLDPENPWPGLLAFPEEATRFFHGRDVEAAELFRLVERDALTLLYGQSGLGKTSLLLAGLFPRLRREHFLPVYVRLDHDPAAPPPRDQVLMLLMDACREQQVEAAPPREGDSLWEYVHRVDNTLWDSRNHPVTPVFVIDQFEEIFTLGQGTEERTRRFFMELGNLIDNRPPEDLFRHLHQHPQAEAQYAFNQLGCRIVLSLREDFYAELDRLRPYTRSRMQNELHLRRMTGEQAYAAVLQTGGHVVEAPVAEEIVRFLARAAPRDGAGEAALEGLEVEPALLSVVCRELNERRKQRDLPRIEADLLHGSQEEILSSFYERSLEGLPPAVRTFVEEKLLTEGGYRASYPVDDARHQPGVSDGALSALVTRRLIRMEERFGAPRVELTHDVLTGIIRDSRDRRHLEELRARAAAERARTRRVAVVLGGLLVIFASLAIAAGTSIFIAKRSQRQREELAHANRRLATSEGQAQTQARRNEELAEERLRQALLTDELADQFRHQQARQFAQLDSLQATMAQAARESGGVAENIVMTTRRFAAFKSAFCSALRNAQPGSADAAALNQLRQQIELRLQATSPNPDSTEVACDD